MAKKAATIKSAGGIGESKTFGAPEGTFDENPILNCHVAGTQVRDLPIEMQGRIVFQQTDEGIAAANEGKAEPSGVELGAGPWEKSLQQRKDDLSEREMEPYEARDPLREVADKFVAKGMKGKFLSPRKVKERGTTGDYQIVKDENGDPVQVHGMILGQAPEGRVNARNRHYQGKSKAAIAEITQRYKAEGGATAVADQ